LTRNISLSSQLPPYFLSIINLQRSVASKLKSPSLLNNNEKQGGKVFNKIMFIFEASFGGSFKGLSQYRETE
jgi:hypothetical protein